MATDANKNNRNCAALTLMVSEVITRNSKVIGKAVLHFTPKGKTAFDLPVTLMAEEGSTPAKGIKVGQVNAVGALLYKEEEYQGKVSREYTLWADQIMPFKEGKKLWRKVTFTGWIQAPLGNRVAGVRYSDTSGEPFTTHTLAVGMGKDRKKLYIDIKGVTVKGDSSIALAMAEAEPGDTVRVRGTLDANQSPSNRIYLSVVVFSPFEPEGEESGNAREVELPFEIIKKGEPRAEAAPASGVRSDPFSSDPFSG